MKIKLYRFFLGYGRFGTAEENAAARAVLSKLHWAPFHPSSNKQLLTIRILEATRKLVAVRGRDRTAAIAEVASLAEQRSKAADDPLQKLASDFETAERSGNTTGMMNIVAAIVAAYVPAR